MQRCNNLCVQANMCSPFPTIITHSEPKCVHTYTNPCARTPPKMQQNTCTHIHTLLTEAYTPCAHTTVCTLHGHTQTHYCPKVGPVLLSCMTESGKVRAGEMTQDFSDTSLGAGVHQGLESDKVSPYW